MNRKILLGFIILIISGTSVADSFLSAQQFPKTFDDLSFSAQQEFKSEDYAIFADLDAYDQLNIVYTDQNINEEIQNDEQETQGSATTVPVVMPATTTFGTSGSQTGGTSSGYCAIKHPSVPRGQTVPIGKPVLEEDYIYCSPYGQRNFGTKEKPKWDNHYGFDIGCKERVYDKPVFTTADGVVEKIKHNGRGSSAGNYIRINHGNGFTTYYMHLNQILVTQGQHVSAGCQIATIGNTGGAKAFKGALQNDYPTMRKEISHLHYEIHYSGNQSSVSGIKIVRKFSNSKAIDPAYFMGVKK